MRGIVDRIEGNMAVVEIGDKFVDILLSKSVSVNEGDVVETDGNVIISAVKDETETRKKAASKLLEELFKKNL